MEILSGPFHLPGRVSDELTTRKPPRAIQCVGTRLTHGIAYPASSHGARMAASCTVNLATSSEKFDGAESLNSAPIRRGGGGGESWASNGRKFGQGESQRTEHHKAPDSGAAGQHAGRRAAMLLGASTLWAGFGGLRVCEEAAAAVAVEDWDYGRPCGPSQWIGMCKSGSSQSPVDITSSNTDDRGGSLGVLDFVYSPSTVSVKNTGHGSIEVSFGKATNFMRVRGQTLQLLQFHFHAPSEHAFDGKHYPMEAHLIHRDPISAKNVVVGVMLDASNDVAPNKCLAASLDFVPQESGLSVDAPIRVSPSFLLPPLKNGYRGYVHYGGSLTTPPCSEDVEWFVLDTPLMIHSSQVVDFMRFSGEGQSLAFNSRPLQPLGNRTIFKGP